MSEATRTLADIVELLAPALGKVKAAEIVEKTAREHRVGPREPLTREQALAILETIAESAGLVGVTARFAKARLHVSWR